MASDPPTTGSVPRIGRHIGREQGIACHIPGSLEQGARMKKAALGGLATRTILTPVRSK